MESELGGVGGSSDIVAAHFLFSYLFSSDITFCTKELSFKIRVLWVKKQHNIQTHKFFSLLENTR